MSARDHTSSWCPSCATNIVRIVPRGANPIITASSRRQTLLDLLDIDSETALRQRISEFRKRVVELADERWGLPLGRDAVIENKFRAGYRLNPDVVLIDPAEIEQSASSQMKTRRSQLPRSNLGISTS